MINKYFRFEFKLISSVCYETWFIRSLNEFTNYLTMVNQKGVTKKIHIDSFNKLKKEEVDAY